MAAKKSGTKVYSVKLFIPSNIPTPERGRVLRDLYNKWVLHPDGAWKGPAVAEVPAKLANDVAEAMDFMGSIVDERTKVGNKVRLYSKGYWAHGF